MPLQDEWPALGGLMFTAKRLVDGLYAGSHASWRRGAGLEFHDYRPYSPGDDPKDIDWKLYGRTDRLYLRQYRQRTDLHLYILVDATASMGFAGFEERANARTDRTSVTKFEYARLLAAAIAFLAIRQNDRVGLGLMTNRLSQYLPPASGAAHLQKFCWTLETAQLGSGPGDIGAAIRHARSLVKRRGLFVIISDLLDEPDPFFDALNWLGHNRFDAAVFQVLTRSELDLSTTVDRGGMKITDPETRLAVPAEVVKIRQRYSLLMSRHVDTIALGCGARGMDHHLITTDQPIVVALRRYLSYGRVAAR